MVKTVQRTTKFATERIKMSESWASNRDQKDHSFMRSGSLALLIKAHRIMRSSSYLFELMSGTVPILLRCFNSEIDAVVSATNQLITSEFHLMFGWIIQGFAFAWVDEDCLSGE
jgi:hypothetical protein